jgi:hypothetical protein
MMHSFLVSLVLISISLTAPIIAAYQLELFVDAAKTGAEIDGNIFGRFAKRLWSQIALSDPMRLNRMVESGMNKEIKK